MDKYKVKNMAIIPKIKNASFCSAGNNVFVPSIRRMIKRRARLSNQEMPQPIFQAIPTIIKASIRNSSFVFI